MKKNNKDGSMKIALCMLLLCVVLCALGLYMYNSMLKECSDDFRNSFIALYAGALGGFCTLFGVHLTILADRIAKKREISEQCIPEFFQPLTDGFV